MNFKENIFKGYNIHGAWLESVVCAFGRTSTELKFSKKPYAVRDHLCFIQVGYDFLTWTWILMAITIAVAWCREGSSTPSQSFTRMSRPLSQKKFQPEDHLACGLPAEVVNSDVSESQWVHSNQNTWQGYFPHTHFDFGWLYVPSS